VSHNIDSVDVLLGKLWISRAKLRQACRRVKEDDRPEGCFLNDLEEREKADDELEIFEVTEPDWHGEGSGHAYETFKVTLGFTTGSMDLVLSWPRGRSSGLRVVDGKVEEMDVVRQLVPREKKK
jgi:hypothetical protein